MNGEERFKILKMVEEGKVSAEEGLRLLDALSEGEETIPPAIKGEAKTLRVRIQEGDKTKVNITFPLSLAKFAAKFIPEDVEGLREILNAIESGEATGKIVDVEDAEGNTKVEISIE
ncbi:MAG: SHOCT-like domain-containing protein [bacterium]